MANGSCTVTPGVVVASNSTLNSSTLNLLGKPVVVVDPKSIGKDQLVASEVLELLGDGAAGYNYLDNGNFAENRWTRGSTPVSCPTTAKTYRADQWWVTPAGAAATYERVQSGPNTLSLHSAKLTGATGVTTLDFGQDVPRRLATALATKLLLSFWIHNDTGANVTPTVLANTADAADNFGSVTNRITQAASVAAATGTWQQYEVALDATGLTNIANGLQVVLRFPSGSLSSGAKSVTVAQVKLEATAETVASQFVPQRETPDASATALPAPANLLVNGQLDRFLRGGNTAAALTVSVDNYVAAGFFVNPAGASTATGGLSTAAPANNLTGQSLRITGGAGVNAVDVGQRIEPEQAPKLRRNMILSVWVKYHDGATSLTIAPTLLLNTCDNRGSWGTTTNRVTAPLDPCVNDTWTLLTYQFDGSGLTNVANGVRLALELPSASLDANTKYVEVAQWLLEAGVQASALAPRPEAEVPAAVVGAASGLAIACSSSTQLTVTADELVLRGSDGRAATVYAVSEQADITVSGAGGLDTGIEATSTWYYVWVIGNGLNVKALLSVSATAPTLPAGYNQSALVGAVYNNSAGNFVSFQQYGRKAWPANTTPALNGAGATSYTTLSLAAFVPPIAKTVFGTAGSTGAVECRLALSADGAGSHAVTIVGADGGAAFNNFRSSGWYELPLLTAQTISYIMGQATNYRIEVLGYTI